MEDATLDALEALYGAGITGLEKCNELRDFSDTSSSILRGLLPGPPVGEVSEAFRAISDALAVHREHGEVARAAIYQAYDGGRKEPLEFCGHYDSHVVRIVWDVIYRVGEAACLALEVDTEKADLRTLSLAFPPKVTQNGLLKLTAAYKLELENTAKALPKRPRGGKGGHVALRRNHSRNSGRILLTQS